MLLHIYLLEMEAMFWHLPSFQEGVTDLRVTALCDSSTVVANVNQQDGTVVGQSPYEVVRESRPPPQYEVSTEAVLCSGRYPQPSGSGYRGSVVSPPAGGNRSAPRLGLPVAGLVHDVPLRDTSPMLFPHPGSPGGL